jgi:hypothetical protein
LLFLQLVEIISNPTQLQAAKDFTSQTSTWLEQREEEIGGVIFNMRGYCARLQCGTTIVSAMDTLETIRKDAGDISTALEGHGDNICPTVGCLNLDFVWFLKNSTCLCDQDGIALLGKEADEGEQAAPVDVKTCLHPST